MNQRPGSNAPDYLIIGHITRDLVNGEIRLGGTAVYASLLAKRMGLDTVLLTSFAADLDLDILQGIEIINQPGKGTTTFKNIYNSTGRTQFILETAPILNLDLIPQDIKNARIIHFGPVAGEIPILAGESFPGSQIGYSLQGWLRTWDEGGQIESFDIHIPRGRKPAPGIAFLSLEDLDNQRSGLTRIRELFPQVVLTTGEMGAELYLNEQAEEVFTEPAEPIDPTGAGDIFAAAYLIAKIKQGRSHTEAARLANALAGISILRNGVDGVPTESEIAEVQRNL